MGLSAKVGTFVLNAGTGNQAIAGVGFRPEIVLFLYTENTADGIATNFNTGFGVGISSSARAAVGSNDEDNVATTDCARRWQTDRCLLMTAPGSSSTIRYEVDLVTLDADGFTIDIIATSGTQSRIGYLALAGTDLTNVATGIFAGSGGGGNQAIAGVGFQPDAIILYSIAHTTIPPIGASDNILSIGFAISSTERAAFSLSSKNNETTSVTSQTQVTDAVVLLQEDDGPVVGKADFVSMDADGFTIDWSNADTSYIGYIAFRGGRYAVGTVTSQTDPGEFSETGVGFRPSAGIFLSFCNAATGSVVEGLVHSASFATASDERIVIGGTCEDNVGTSNTDQFQDDGLMYKNYDYAQAVVGAADFVSWDADGFTLDQTDVDPAGNEIIYLVIGADAAARIPRYGFTNFQIPGIV